MNTKRNEVDAVVVLSGGQDSTICLYWAKNTFGAGRVAAVTFNYNQRHSLELVAAHTVAKMAGIRSHEIINLGPVLHGTSPLTNPKEELETYDSYEIMHDIIGNRIEKTFVPMRNALFLTIAANRAAVLGAHTIVTGVCQMDNANYPDCREEFIDAQTDAINQALGNKKWGGDPEIVIVPPLLNMSKAESIHEAAKLPGCFDALAHSHTAYDGCYPPTSRDHASVLRAQGFIEAGYPDPLVVRAWRDGEMALPETSNYTPAAFDLLKTVA